MRLYEAAGAWGASMAAWGAADETRGKRLDLLRYLERRGWADPSAVTRGDVEAFLGDPSFRPWTRVTYYNHLRAFFRWATEAGVILTDPMAGMRRPRSPHGIPKPLTAAETAAVLAAAQGNVRAFVLLALRAGLRAHEIAKIRGEDVTGDQLYVCGKGGTEAFIPTHSDLWALAQEYPRRGWWFPSPRDTGHVRGNSVGIMVGRVFREAGITGSIHRCRHTYATSLLRNGANLRVVQTLMRHSSLATTEVYLQVDEVERRTAVGLLT